MTELLSICPSLDFQKRALWGFYGLGGWSEEPVGKILNIPGEICGEIFHNQCPFRPELSVTLKYDNKYIGMSDVNNYSDYLKYFPLQVNAVLDRNMSENINKFCKINKKIVEIEINEMVPILENLNIDLKYVAHRCGLMVLSLYNGLGFGTWLISKSDELLKSLNYKAIVVSTSHIGSQKVFEKNGYEILCEINHCDFGIELNNASIMYKIL